MVISKSISLLVIKKLLWISDYYITFFDNLTNHQILPKSASNEYIHKFLSVQYLRSIILHFQQPSKLVILENLVATPSVKTSYLYTCFNVLPSMYSLLFLGRIFENGELLRFFSHNWDLFISKTKIVQLARIFLSLCQGKLRIQSSW